MGLADDLISEAHARVTAFTLPDAARDDIARVIRHNDAAPRVKKISIERVIDGLHRHYGIEANEKTLRRYIKREFGRTFLGGGK